MISGDSPHYDDYYGYNSILSPTGNRIRRMRRTEFSNQKKSQHSSNNASVNKSSNISRNSSKCDNKKQTYVNSPSTIKKLPHYPQESLANSRSSNKDQIKNMNKNPSSSSIRSSRPNLKISNNVIKINMNNFTNYSNFSPSTATASKMLILNQSSSSKSKIGETKKKQKSIVYVEYNRPIDQTTVQNSNRKSQSKTQKVKKNTQEQKIDRFPKQNTANNTQYYNTFEHQTYRKQKKQCISKKANTKSSKMAQKQTQLQSNSKGSQYFSGVISQNKIGLKSKQNENHSKKTEKNAKYKKKQQTYLQSNNHNILQQMYRTVDELSLSSNKANISSKNIIKQFKEEENTQLNQKYVKQKNYQKIKIPSKILQSNINQSLSCRKKQQKSKCIKTNDKQQEKDASKSYNQCPFIIPQKSNFSTQTNIVQNLQVKQKYYPISNKTLPVQQPTNNKSKILEINQVGISSPIINKNKNEGKIIKKIQKKDIAPFPNSNKSETKNYTHVKFDSKQIKRTHISQLQTINLQQNPYKLNKNQNLVSKFNKSPSDRAVIEKSIKSSQLNQSEIASIYKDKSHQKSIVSNSSQGSRRHLKKSNTSKSRLKITNQKSIVRHSQTPKPHSNQDYIQSISHSSERQIQKNINSYYSPNTHNFKTKNKKESCIQMISDKNSQQNEFFDKQELNSESSNNSSEQYFAEQSQISITKSIKSSVGSERSSASKLKRLRISNKSKMRLSQLSVGQSSKKIRVSIQKPIKGRQMSPMRQNSKIISQLKQNQAIKNKQQIQSNLEQQMSQKNQLQIKKEFANDQVEIKSYNQYIKQSKFISNMPNNTQYSNDIKKSNRNSSICQQNSQLILQKQFIEKQIVQYQKVEKSNKNIIVQCSQSINKSKENTSKCLSEQQIQIKKQYQLQQENIYQSTKNINLQKQKQIIQKQQSINSEKHEKSSKIQNNSINSNSQLKQSQKSYSQIQENKRQDQYIYSNQNKSLDLAFAKKNKFQTDKNVNEKQNSQKSLISLKNKNLKSIMTIRSGRNLKPLTGEAKIQEFIGYIDQYQLSLGFLYLYCENTKLIYSPQNGSNKYAEKYQKLEFLIMKKFLFQKNKIVKCLKQIDNKNYFTFSGLQIPDKILKKFINSSQTKQKIEQYIDQTKQIFKGMQELYRSLRLKSKYKKDSSIKMQAPIDDFSKQSVGMLLDQLNQLMDEIDQLEQMEYPTGGKSLIKNSNQYKKPLSNQPSQIQSVTSQIADKIISYEQRCIQIMEIVFLISEMQGRKVKKLQLLNTEDIQFQMYYETNIEKMLETCQFFQSLCYPSAT